MTFEELAKANRQIKTRNIKGKEYAEVNERIKAFRMLYPDGAIVTDIIDMHDGIVTMKATVMDADGRVLGTGTAQEKEGSTYINKTSYLENCETSAVGRALGMLGIGVDTSVASAEEVENAINGQGHGQSQEPQPYTRKTEEAQDSPRRKAALQLWEAKGQDPHALREYVYKKTGKTISKNTSDSEWADVLDIIKNDSSLHDPNKIPLNG